MLTGVFSFVCNIDAMENAANLTDLFLALADKTRLRILNLLAVRETSVLNFARILQEPQPKISRHLAYLRDAELVETRRSGKKIYYNLTMPENDFARHVLREVLSKLAGDEQMQNDRKLSNETTFLIVGDESNEIAASDAFAEPNASPPKAELAVFLL